LNKTEQNRCRNNKEILKENSSKLKNGSKNTQHYARLFEELQRMRRVLSRHKRGFQADVKV
jgi:hypothetical protein